MNAVTDMLNPGTVSNPAVWIDDQLKAAQKYGFPFVSLVNINDEMATALMERNDHNRPLRMRRAMRYRHDMMNSLWIKANGETIIVTSEGKMISGQHRCVAIIDTDLVIPTFIALGVQPASDTTVDQGAPKNAGDYLAMQGEENAPTIARIARLRMAYDANEGEALKDASTATNSDVMRYVSEHHDDVERSAALAVSLREHTKPIAAPSIIGFVHNLLHDIDGAAADQYIQQVAKGEELKEGDPAFTVRSRLLTMGKAAAARKTEILLQGWNAFHSGRKLKTVRISGRFPRLV